MYNLAPDIILFGEKLVSWSIDRNRLDELESNSGSEALYLYHGTYFLVCYDDEGAYPEQPRELTEAQANKIIAHDYKMKSGPDEE